MPDLKSLDRYLAELCQQLGLVNRHQNFSDHVEGLLLVEERKSVEPMVAVLDPINTHTKHQGTASPGCRFALV